MARAAPKEVEELEKDTSTLDNSTIVEYSEDISDAEAPDPLPIADNYPMAVHDAKVVFSKSSGRKQFDVTLVVSPEDFPADYDVNQNPDGVFLHKYISAEDNAKARYQVRLFEEALGLDPSGRSVDCSRWVGQQTVGGITHEPWEGNMRERLGKLKAPA